MSRLALARHAVAAQQALAGALPRRADFTERTVLSRHSPFPLPEDAVVVVRNNFDEATRNKHALLGKHGLVAPVQGVVARAVAAPAKPAPAPGADAKRLPLTLDVYQDCFAACKDAIHASEGTTLYYLAKLASGVAKECRVPVSVATDCAHTGYFLQTMLARAPSSSPAAKLLVSHSLTPDAWSKNVPYVGYSAEAPGVVARGRVPLGMFLDSVVGLSAKINEGCSVLTFKCDARVDKAGVKTLVFGAPSVEASASAGDLLGAHHVAWTESKGILRIWDGALVATGGVAVAPGVNVAPVKAATYPGQPSRLSFVVDPVAKKGKPIDAARARTLLAEKYRVAGGSLAADKALEVIDQLLARAKPEMLVFE